MGMQEKVVPALAYGASFGTLFYMLGGIASGFFPAITPAAAGAVGLFSAVAIALTSEAK